MNIKISKGLVKGIELHRCELKDKTYALVGILSSLKNNEIIDNTYFIKHRRGGCQWCPRLEKKDIAQTIYKVLKEKRDIRGLVLILAKNLSTGMNNWFWEMIYDSDWANNKFVYITSGHNGLRSYKISDIRSFSKASLTKV